MYVPTRIRSRVAIYIDVYTRVSLYTYKHTYTDIYIYRCAHEKEISLAIKAVSERGDEGVRLLCVEKI